MRHRYNSFLVWQAFKKNQDRTKKYSPDLKMKKKTTLPLLKDYF